MKILLYLFTFYLGFAVGIFICQETTICGFSIEHTKYIFGEFCKNILYLRQN